MSYVDGYVIPVKKSKVKAYAKMARMGLQMWMRHGASDYKECVLDDAKVFCGPGFAKGIRAKPGETVFFSFIVYKSKAHRDRVNKKVMKDMEKCGMPPEIPFDMKRMLYAGFRTVVE